MFMKFTLQHTAPQTKARAGVIETDHGTIETPIFMPVGTAAAMKGIFHRDVEQEAKVQVVEAVTNHDDVAEDVAVEVAEDAEEPAPEPQPKRRGRPRKNPEAETEPAPEGAQPAVRRRSRAKKEESKELFPFYEQSLF